MLKYPGVSQQLGSEGEAVKQIQARLRVQQTARFGPTTENCVKAFQAVRGLKEDGIVGPLTWNALFAEPNLDGQAYPGKELQEGSEGDDVKQIQARLGVQQTGRFGPTTEMAVTTFQQAQGLEVDGVVGPQTWKALFAKNAESRDLAGVALQTATKLIGVTEQPRGSNKGPLVNQFLERAGLIPGNPWCMAFVFYCVDEAAKELGVDNPLARVEGKGSCSAFFRWARENDKLVSCPQPGDIFLCIGGETGHFHTGFVAGPIREDDRYITIEGNSNDDGSANGIEVAHRHPGRRISSCHYVRM